MLLKQLCEMMVWNPWGMSYLSNTSNLVEKRMPRCLHFLSPKDLPDHFLYLSSAWLLKSITWRSLFWKGILQFHTSFKFKQPVIPHLSICWGFHVGCLSQSHRKYERITLPLAADPFLSSLVILKMWMESSSDSVWEDDIHAEQHDLNR